MAEKDTSILLILIVGWCGGRMAECLLFILTADPVSFLSLSFLNCSFFSENLDLNLHSIVLFLGKPTLVSGFIRPLNSARTAESPRSTFDPTCCINDSSFNYTLFSLQHASFTATYPASRFRSFRLYRMSGFHDPRDQARPGGGG